MAVEEIDEILAINRRIYAPKMPDWMWDRICSVLREVKESREATAAIAVTVAETSTLIEKLRAGLLAAVDMAESYASDAAEYGPMPTERLAELRAIAATARASITAT